MIFKAALSTVSLIALLFNPALAGDADFTLTNRTGYDIDSVYVVPSKQRDWGSDRLGKSILRDGRSRFMTFNKSGNTCIYDLSVGWVGYDEDEDVFWEQINLCEINTITLRYNSKTRVTSMTAE